MGIRLSRLIVQVDNNTREIRCCLRAAMFTRQFLGLVRNTRGYGEQLFGIIQFNRKKIHQIEKTDNGHISEITSYVKHCKSATVQMRFKEEEFIFKNR